MQPSVAHAGGSGRLKAPEPPTTVKVHKIAPCFSSSGRSENLMSSPQPLGTDAVTLTAPFSGMIKVSTFVPSPPTSRNAVVSWSAASDIVVPCGTTQGDVYCAGLLKLAVDTHLVCEGEQGRTNRPAGGGSEARAGVSDHGAMADITPRTPRRTSRRAHPSSCLCDTVPTSSPNVSPKRCFRPTPLKKAARGGFCRESGRGCSLRRPRCPCPRPRFSRPARAFNPLATIAN